MTESDPERTHRSRCVSVLNSSHPRADLGRDRAQKGPCLGPQDHRELPHAWYAAYPSIALPSMKRLQTLLGDNPLTSALRRGEIASDRVAVDFVDHRPTNTGFIHGARGQVRRFRDEHRHLSHRHSAPEAHGILRVLHEGASIIFQALPDGSRKLASTPAKRAIGSCMNSTPLARSLS